LLCVLRMQLDKPEFKETEVRVRDGKSIKGSQKSDIRDEKEARQKH